MARRKPIDAKCKALQEQGTLHRRPEAVTDEVMRFVRKARLEAPSRRARDLARLVGERFGLQIHPRTIERALARREKKRG